MFAEANAAAGALRLLVLSIARHGTLPAYCVHLSGTMAWSISIALCSLHVDLSSSHAEELEMNSADSARELVMCEAGMLCA